MTTTDCDAGSNHNPRAQAELKGRQPKLTQKQRRELKRMHETGEHTIADLGELFSVSRPTVYRTITHTAAKCA